MRSYVESEVLESGCAVWGLGRGAKLGTVHRERRAVATKLFGPGKAYGH